jgi:hypothetical protein
MIAYDISPTLPNKIAVILSDDTACFVLLLPDGNYILSDSLYYNSVKIPYPTGIEFHANLNIETTFVLGYYY